MKSHAFGLPFSSGVFAKLLLFASFFCLDPAAFADSFSDYSFSGIRRHRDSGDGTYSYYPVTSVPGKEHEKFFFGTYTWSYPLENGRSITLSEDAGYLIDCRTTQITRVFSALHVSPKTLLELPSELAYSPDIANRIRQSSLTRVVKVTGLETKNYRLHNVLGQVVTYMDTSAFRLTCGEEPTYFPK